MKKYKIKYQDNSKLKELIINSDDLSKENLPDNIISIKKLDSLIFNNLIFFSNKISDKQINLIFYELDLMLNAGININEAINILIKNKKDEKVKALLHKINDSFINKTSFHSSLKEFNINYLVSSFLELSSKKGNIASNINALNNLLRENQEIKEIFLKSIRYPIVLIISFLLSLFSIFYFVVPKFKVIFEQTSGELPLATKVLLNLQFIFENYFIYILLGIVSMIVISFYYYKNNSEFKYFLDKVLVKDMFLFKDIYLNLEIYKVFLIIDIMQKSNYEFHNALVSSKILLKNKYLLDKISLIDNLLQNGKSISYSFSRTELFDDIILNLINTAEVSNSLDKTVEEITRIYKNRFNEKIKLLTTLIAPMFLVTIMSLIVWIVLAVFMPIWDMGNMIKI